MLDIEIDDRDLGRALEEYGRELDRQTTRAMRNAGAAIAAEARVIAPVGPTRHLAGSIQGVEPTGSFTGGDLAGGAVAIAAYAAYVEDGTRPHVIVPRHRRFLRFPNPAGGFLFRRRVQHPGTRAQPFMEPALDRALPGILAEFQAAADLAALRVGL